ncbi:spermidine/putrescine ABC transporter substrate-binding protein [Candidatus Peribacteria bacterium]|nr:spermidine/putrescine ABC transporter substrate-binding protein [Candidatus Peribacteria bacterium]
MKKLLLVLLAFCVIGAGYFALSRNAADTGPEELTVLSWDDYIGLSTISDFEKETGATVTYEVIKSNEEALARVKSNPGVYDVIVVSDYMVDIIKAEDGAMMIDKKGMENLENIGDAFRGTYFDKNMEYSVPYAFGTTGFAVNTQYIKDTPISWKELSKPEYKGKIAMIDDMRYVLGSVLMELGFDPNSTDAQEIAAAVNLLKSVMPNVAKITESSPIDLMVNENVWVSYAWSGDILQMHTQNADIEYKIPDYGSLTFLDNMLIPADAPHRELARRYIDFILRPDVSAAITDEIQYGNPNTAAWPMISEEIRESPMVFPAAETIAKLQYIKDIGDDIALYEEAWESIKQ